MLQSYSQMNQLCFQGINILNFKIYHMSLLTAISINLQNVIRYSVSRRSALVRLRAERRWNEKSDYKYEKAQH